MGANFLKVLAIVFVNLSIMISCGVDDETSTSNDIGEFSSTVNFSRVDDYCTSPKDQIAQGNFLGTNFVSPGGAYRDQSFGWKTEYFCKIYVKSPLDTEDCAFPRFEGNRDIISFSINTLEPQTFKVSNEFASDDGRLNKTLSFNRVTEIEAVTITELSSGVVTITSYDDITDKLYGSVIAEGVNGSNINGNFVLDFCDKNVF